MCVGIILLFRSKESIVILFLGASSIGNGGLLSCSFFDGPESFFVFSFVTTISSILSIAILIKGSSVRSISSLIIISIIFSFCFLGSSGCFLITVSNNLRLGGGTNNSIDSSPFCICPGSTTSIISFSLIICFLGSLDCVSFLEPVSKNLRLGGGAISIDSSLFCNCSDFFFSSSVCFLDSASFCVGGGIFIVMVFLLLVFGVILEDLLSTRVFVFSSISISRVSEGSFSFI